MPAAIKTKRVSADEAREKRSDHMRDTERGSAVVKAAKAPVSYDSEDRSGRFIMTTEQPDRYADIVVTDGLDITEFLRNPVGLLFHNSRTWPVANWTNVEKILKGRPRRMEGDFKLLPGGGPIPEIDQTAWMLENGGIRACSIGFIPDWSDVEMILDEEDRWTGGFRFNKSELVECSVCPIPANPGALMKHAGGDMRMAKELLEYVLDTYVKTGEGLLVPRAEFEKTHKVVIEKIAADTSAKLPVTDEEKAAAEIRALEFEVAKLYPAIEGATAAVDGDGIKAKLLVKDGKWKHAGDSAEGDIVNFLVLVALDGDKRAYIAERKVEEAEKVLPKNVRTKDGWLVVHEKNSEAAAFKSVQGEGLQRAARTVTGTKPEAKTAEAAEMLVGQKVTFDPSHADNKSCVHAQEIGRGVGEIVASYIVDDGEKKGAHALWVEFLTNSWTGMFRGIEAERFLLVPTGNEEPEVSKDSLSIKIQADVAEAETALKGVLTLAETVSQKLSSIFGKKSAPQERVEPKLDTQAAQPSAEAIDAARERSAAIKQRLTQKSLI